MVAIIQVMTVAQFSSQVGLMFQIQKQQQMNIMI